MSDKPFRVWIELPPPDEDDIERNKEACRLVNNMLKRLSEPDDPDRNKFWYSEHEHRYCYGGPMGYVSLADNGHWLNLSYLGRDL